MSNTDDKAEAQRIERKARRVWVSIVIGLLGLQVVAGVSTVVLATGDPTVAIIPNYHDSAVNWDTTRRARQLTDKLGLQVKPVVSAVDEKTGRRTLQVQLLDQNDKALRGVFLEARVFHHAAGSEVHLLKLVEGAPGVYSAETSLVQAGLWQVDLRIDGTHGIAATSEEIRVR
ncbi:MAG: hypothetical protein Aurels2KO_13130 [Aureliella sp.]